MFTATCFSLLSVGVALTGCGNPTSPYSYTRCACNPLTSAGYFHKDTNQYEISIGDPDVLFDAPASQWRAFWSTGLATTYFGSNTLVLKAALSPDGYAWDVQPEPVLRSGISPSLWDYSAVETPSIVRMPSGSPPDRAFLLMYSGGNHLVPHAGTFSFTWYQIGAAFSPDPALNHGAYNFTRAPSPYQPGTMGFSDTRGLVLLGKDVFPGLPGVVDAICADPDVILGPDGRTLHLFFSSMAVGADGTILAYGIGHATSPDGIHWTPTAGNPIVIGGAGPSIIKGLPGAPPYSLFYYEDSQADKDAMPNTFAPERGAWELAGDTLEGPWVPAPGNATGGRAVAWDGSVPTEALGWVATGDMAAGIDEGVNGERRWYYPGLSTVNPPSGWVVPTHTGTEPAVFALSVMVRSEGGTPTPTPTSSSPLPPLGNFTRYVNPLLASRGGGGFGGWGNSARNPGAMAPTPFLRLGPDTTRMDLVLGEAWSHLNRHAGYFASDTHIRGFSHTHVQGAGDADLGNIGVSITRVDGLSMEALVSKRPVPLPFPPLTLDRSPFATPFTHGDEDASPGYYRVGLPAVGTGAELVASGTHGGAHRYTCTTGLSPGASPMNITGPCTLVVDVCHRTHGGPCGNLSTVTITPPAPNATSSQVFTIAGAHQDRGEFVRFNYTGVMVYFHMEVAAVNEGTGEPVAPSFTSAWSEYTIKLAQSASVGGDLDSLGAFLVFPSPAIITVRVGLSTVSGAAAAANLKAEQGDGSGGYLGFDAIRAAMDAQWDTLLGAIQVTLPEDASGGGVTDEGALKAGFEAAAADIPGAGGTTAPTATPPEFMAALQAYLETPQGVAMGVQHGWVSEFPGEFLEAVREARSGGAGGSFSSSFPPTFPRLQVNVSLAAEALRAGSAASRAQSQAAKAASGSSSDLGVFYTMLYLSLCAPSTYSNSGDGGFLGFDGAVHPPTPLPASSFLSDLSLWDTYRAHAPLLALIAPRILADTTASLLTMTAQGGQGMPRWPFANLYTGDMVGHHGLELLAECVVVSGACQGVVSVEEAWAVAQNVTAAQDKSIPEYEGIGWVPFGVGPASLTLDWAYNDHSASALANASGAGVAGAGFAARAGSWRAAFDTGAMKGKDWGGVILPRFENGTFLDNTTEVWVPHPFNPFYTEGNAAHYTYGGVAHDMEGLVGAFPGGPAAFAASLAVVLVNQTQWTAVFSTFLPNPAAWLGNEPSMLIPWAHAAAGPSYSWLTQFWPRWHLREYYQPVPDCIPGNDDYGTLSAWAVWAYLGLYPVAATGRFILGSPVFATARIAVPPGYGPYGSGGDTNTLAVTAHNASAGSIYVASVRVNGGPPLTAPFVTWSQLWPTPGFAATLEFSMVDTPTPWMGAADAPPL